jgi:hypothetical protein
MKSFECNVFNRRIFKKSQIFSFKVVFLNKTLSTIHTIYKWFIFFINKVWIRQSIKTKFSFSILKKKFNIILSGMPKFFLEVENLFLKAWNSFLTSFQQIEKHRFWNSIKLTQTLPKKVVELWICSFLSFEFKMIISFTLHFKTLENHWNMKRIKPWNNQ